MNSAASFRSLCFLLLLCALGSCDKKSEIYTPPAPLTPHDARTITDYSFGDSSYHRMDLYFPQGYTSATPVVFVVPDGGFASGIKADATPIAERFLAKGYIAVTMNYVGVDTLGVYYPDSPYHRESHIHVAHQVDDVRRAIVAYINGTWQWGSGSGSMYVAGHGYGGTLAMLYTYGPYNTDNNARACASFGGVTDFSVDNDTPYAPKPALEQKRLAELFFRAVGVFPVTASNELIHLVSPYWVAMERGGHPTISLYPELNATLGLPNEAARGYAGVTILHDYLRSKGIAEKAVLIPGADHDFNGGPGDGLDVAVNQAAEFLKKQ